MQKVLLPKEIVKAIESLNQKWDKRAMLQLRFYQHFDVTHPEVKIIHDYFNVFTEEGFEKLVTALYLGYEVEQTPEDIILNWDKGLERVLNGEEYGSEGIASAKREAIREVLSILNIKIEGVNA